MFSKIETGIGSYLYLLICLSSREIYFLTVQVFLLPGHIWQMMTYRNLNGMENDMYVLQILFTSRNDGGGIRFQKVD